MAEEWEVVRAHFCQFKQRHLSGGASAACLLPHACVCVTVIKQAGDHRT